MSHANVISGAYSTVEGLGALRSLGATLLGLALVVCLVVELYRLIVNGQADFLTPIIRIGVALVVLESIVPIGVWISSAVDSAASALFDVNLKKLALKSFLAVFEGIEKAGVNIADRLTTPAGILLVGSTLVLFLVLVVKFIVIDVIWPVMFTVVLFSGLLAIPVGLFPGMQSFKGWVLNIIEIGLWPVVFSLVTTLLFATFATQLQDVQKDNGLWAAQAEADQAQVQGQSVDEATKAKASSSLFVLLKYLAINLAYGVVCVFVPMMARKVVRSESAGFLGGIMTAMGTRMVFGVVSSAVRRFVWLGPRLTMMTFNSPYMVDLLTRRGSKGNKNSMPATDQAEPKKQMDGR